MKTTFLAVVLFSFSLSAEAALIQFKDGQTHDIDYQINDEVWVDYQSPGSKTAFNLVAGGKVYNNKLVGYCDSNIGVSGGTVQGVLYAYDSSRINMSAGKAAYLSPHNTSSVTVTGGTADYLWAYDNSEVDLSGGTIGGYLYAQNNTRLNISDGSIGTDLWLWNSNRSEMYGGTIGYNILLGNSAILTLHGSDFSVDGQPVSSGDLTSILGGSYNGEPYRQITGVLANGDVLNNRFKIGETASIHLVPEPSTMTMITALLLSGFVAGRLFFRRKK